MAPQPAGTEASCRVKLSVMCSADKFSLVITAHRAGPMLTACLESAAKLSPPPREIIVAIDGSDERVVREAESRCFCAIPCSTEPGVSAARNAGANAAKGDIVVFADSDVLLRSNHIARVAQAFAEHPEAVAFFGSYDDEPAAPGIVSRYRNLLHHYTHQRAEHEAQTFWAGCGAIRKDIFLAVGGFDESYRMPSVEDIELGYRLRKAGHRIRLVPDWQVKHLKRWTWRDLIFTDIGRRAIPWTRLLRRENRMDNDLNIDRGARLSGALVCLANIAVVTGFFWPPALVIGAALLAAVTVINFDFYRFLARKSGWLFALAAVPLHWLYFLGASVGFLVGHLGAAGKQRNNQFAREVGLT